jgi:hypothetical protein
MGEYERRMSEHKPELPKVGKLRMLLCLLVMLAWWMVGLGIVIALDDGSPAVCHHPDLWVECWEATH